MGEEIIFLMLSFFTYFNNLFFTCYSTTIIVFLLGAIFLKGKYKNEPFNWLYVLNTLVAWLYLINVLIYAVDLFNAWYGQNPYEWYAFSNRPYYGLKYYLIVTIITFCTALLFFIRKLRITRWYIIFFLLVQNFESIVIGITNLYRDYLPSSWSTYYPDTMLVKISRWIGFFVIIAATYCICKKRKKLPYPSLFLK
jgi:hypothetical protein